MQDASLDIWDKKYRLKDKSEQPVDKDINATYMRVAKALSDVESKDKRKEWQEKFVWALQTWCYSGGPYYLQRWRPGIQACHLYY